MSLLAPQDIGTAKGLIRNDPAAIDFSAGETNSAASRKRDAALPRWRRHPTVSLSEFGRRCLSAMPEGAAWVSEHVAAERLKMEKVEVAFAAVAMVNHRKYPKILSVGLPLTMSLLDASDRTMALVFVETLRAGRTGSPLPLAKKAALAWNHRIIGAIPMSPNPLFREIRAKLRPIERTTDFMVERAAVETLRTVVAAGTTAGNHVDTAATFLAEVEELYVDFNETLTPP
jgi:hypothetical protein